MNPVKPVAVAWGVFALAAAPSFGVVVQWSSLEAFVNHGLGPVGENLRSAGYGIPSFYAQESTIVNEGASSQRYAVPGYPTDPDGDGWLFPLHASNGNNPFGATDFAQFVQDLGGPAPTSGPFRITADLRIETSGSATPDDYSQARFRPAFAVTEWLGGSGNSSFAEFDPKGNVNHSFGVWMDDFEILSGTQFPNKMIFILQHTFAVDNPTLGSTDMLNFYLDDLKIEYVPEPATLALLALALPFARRRRAA